MGKGLFRASAYSAWAAASVAAANRWFWELDTAAVMVFTLGAFVGEMACAARMRHPESYWSRPWRFALYLACVIGIALSGFALLSSSVVVRCQNRP